MLIDTGCMIQIDGLSLPLMPSCFQPVICRYSYKFIIKLNNLKKNSPFPDFQKVIIKLNNLKKNSPFPDFQKVV